MAREEALKIGKVIADNWWAKSLATNKKRLRRQALSRKQNTSKEMLPHGKRTFHSRSIFD
ncbi:TPA: hypothetical protein ACHIGN_000155 [Enterococcus faecium]